MCLNKWANPRSFVLAQVVHDHDSPGRADQQNLLKIDHQGCRFHRAFHTDAFHRQRGKQSCVPDTVDWDATGAHCPRGALAYNGVSPRFEPFSYTKTCHLASISFITR